MLFSLRYHRALDRGLIAVELSSDVRKKVWAQLINVNPSFYIQRDPNDNWQDSTSGLAEVERDLITAHGWDRLPGSPYPEENHSFQSLRMLLINGGAPLVFDIIELFLPLLDAVERAAFRAKLNEIFDLDEDCIWRLSDSEFFRIDRDFVGLRNASVAHDALTQNGFAGAVEEFARARRYQAQGDIREAIYLSNHSLESLMKTITGKPHLTADKLIRMLSADGFLNDLPEELRVGFGEQVLKTLPFMRNKLGGHGQGAEILVVPPAYGELAIQIAAAFHNFIITKHLSMAPAPVQAVQSIAPFSVTDDELPF